MRRWKAVRASQNAGAVAALFLLAAPAYGAETSLTGSYSGVVACDRTDDGRPAAFQIPLNIRILQDGDRLHIATWTAGDVALKRRKASLYTGKAVTADGRVSGYVTACRPDFDYQELVRILPALPTEDGLSFSADTIFMTEALPGREGELIVESCRWVMVRQSADPPDMERCANR